VDQKNERLYFATHTTVCWRLISGSEISCKSYDSLGYTFNEIYIPPGTPTPTPTPPASSCGPCGWSFPFGGKKKKKRLID
jgi:hypothetical protein